MTINKPTTSENVSMSKTLLNAYVCLMSAAHFDVGALWLPLLTRNPLA